MLIDTADISTGNPMTAMACEPGLIPRTGDKIVIDSGVTWEVAEIAWRAHPDTLRPILMLRSLVDDHALIHHGPMDAAEADVFTRAAIEEIESR